MGHPSVFLGEAGVLMHEIWKKQYLFVFCILKIFQISRSYSKIYTNPMMPRHGNEEILSEYENFRSGWFLLTTPIAYHFANISSYISL